MQHDGQTFKNISATTDWFTLVGGLYEMDVIGTGFGTVKLEKLAADGTTALSVSSAFAANGGEVDYLAPGSYRVNISSTTAVYFSVSRIPLE